MSRCDRIGIDFDVSDGVPVPLFGSYMVCQLSNGHHTVLVAILEHSCEDSCAVWRVAVK